MLAELTSNQITDWIAYNKIDPIGEWRSDYRIALVCATIVNVGNSLIYVMKGLWSKRAGRKPKFVTVQDFIPDWDGKKTKDEVPDQSIEEQKRMLLSIAKTFGATKGKRTKK